MSARSQYGPAMESRRCVPHEKACPYDSNPEPGEGPRMIGEAVVDSLESGRDSLGAPINPSCVRAQASFSSTIDQIDAYLDSVE